MTPTLASILGPLEGVVFTCGSADLSIGRESSNQVCLRDPLVSRKHCVISKSGERFKITDLHSHNGVSVNGLPTKERYLEHGDQIQIGDSMFLFLVQDEEAPSVCTEASTNSEILARGTTTRLRMDEVIYTNPERLLALPPSTRVTRDLNTLFKIGRIINTVQGTKELQTKLIELCVEAIPAQRAAILLTEPGNAKLKSGLTFDRRSGFVPFQINGEIVNQVFHERVGILTKDVTNQKELAESQIHSLLCVPLTIGKKFLGVTYLDTSDPEVLFDEAHLQLATAIAGIAASALDREQQKDRLDAENQRLRSFIQRDRNMIGEAPAMERVYQMINRIASSNSTVLICGESGTGKELAALAIHLNSSRAQKPFVPINCAALAESLQETELFGHEKGAFTGAVCQKKGKLEIAQGGTVFLDEISEIAISFQAKLLRVLQERQFERVGGTQTINVDVRWIAATNRNLEKAIQEKTFREDLYFRLNVVTLVIPPLRERRDDIPLLANYFATKYGKNFQRNVKGISPSAIDYLVRYDWPGNIRELENAIQRAVIFVSDREILPEDLPENVLEVDQVPGSDKTTYHDAIQVAKKQIIQKALEQSKGNYTQAATLLGIHPVYLYRLTRNLGLK
jgi:transcriptional regulator with GAF, ATPase, and Fis domain